MEVYLSRMKWNTPIKINPLPDLINHRDHILSTGSCFAEQMALFFQKRKIRVLSNPSGIVYNPLSIARLLENLMEERMVSTDELFFRDGLYHHYQFHGSCSGKNADEVAEKMNASLKSAYAQLRNSRFLILTLGTSWVYREKEKGEVVANCHKVPNKQFDKEWLSPAVLHKELLKAFEALQQLSPDIKIIITVSPVRHLRDGAVENSRSKAALLLTAAYLQHSLPDRVFYFPSYELMMDELRDYRFYGEDMVHPSAVATDYIMRRFAEAAFDGETQDLLKRTEDLLRAVGHRPFNPDTEEHQRFRKMQLETVKELMRDFPALDFGQELEYFGGVE